jgi:hypothetical protein
VFGLLAVSAVGPAYAGQLGHYFPGSFNIRDYVMPDKGVYAAVYTIHYASDSLRNASGDDISSVSLAGRTVNVDTDLSLYSISPTVIWNSGWKILGPEYGA